jgi:glycosyltransferase involved in cell wall biosynthesis
MSEKARGALAAKAGYPRVTFALFAYNQKDLISEAMAAAFAQNYPNLEILLSDDGSADGTFELMEAAARDYRGPHAIRVNRTAANRGVIAHVYDACLKAEGELIVAAAGDDISYSHRTSRLVEHWLETGADGLYSDFDTISETGEILVRGRPIVKPDMDHRPFFPGRKVERIVGASSAFSKATFQAIEEPSRPLYAEDLYLTLMLALRSRKTVYVDEILLAYRRHGAATTHVTDDDVALFEKKVEETSRGLHDTLLYFERAVETGSGFDPSWGEPGEVDLAAVRAERRFIEFRRRWTSSTFPERLLAATRFRSYEYLRWLLPRIFGLRTLVAAKRLRLLLPFGG